MVFDPIPARLQLPADCGSIKRPGPCVPGRQALSRNSVHDMLRNEKYKGTLLYNRFVYDKQGRRRRPKPGEANANEIRVPNALPAIVDELTWEKVNQQMDLRAHAGKVHPQRSYLLSGILFCAECGSPMIGVRSRTTLSYRCAGKKAHLTNLHVFHGYLRQCRRACNRHAKNPDT